MQLSKGFCTPVNAQAAHASRALRHSRPAHHIRANITVHQKSLNTFHSEHILLRRRTPFPPPKKSHDQSLAAALITLAFSACEKHASPCCSACTSSGSAASPKSGAPRTLSRSSASSCVTVRKYQDGKAAAAAEAGRASDSESDDGEDEEEEEASEADEVFIRVSSEARHFLYIWEGRESKR